MPAIVRATVLARHSSWSRNSDRNHLFEVTVFRDENRATAGPAERTKTTMADFGHCTPEYSRAD